MGTNEAIFTTNHRLGRKESGVVKKTGNANLS